MPNKLANENSLYLLQHKDNPVEWYPWGDEALKKARSQDKPIFLSIGYAACHWCHVMEYESFEDPETAAIMNRNFVNIKVDREERPDLDSIYMKSVIAMTGQGGWPMSVFLTPEGKPFFGGTYFPPKRRYQLPSFREVLLAVSQLWRSDRDRVDSTSEKLKEHLLREYVPNTSGTPPLTLDTLNNVLMSLAQAYDWDNGGWGKAPKFPQPMTIEFLLRHAQRGDKLALEMATHALDAMAKGGMYDVIGGGFSRYSVDDSWLVPHFEKMLYDNAQLSTVYLYAYLLTKNIEYRDVVEETLNFVIREMRHESGGFFSSLDADSGGEEGKFYVWKFHEIRQILNNPEDLKFFTTAFTITDEGNFEGSNLLQKAMDTQTLASAYGLTHNQAILRLRDLSGKLLDFRARRVRPHADDKVLVSWNAMMLFVFSEVSRYLQNGVYLEVAMRNADFLLRELYKENILFRSWRNGTTKHKGYLEDYASLIIGLLSLYQTDPNPRWYSAVISLAEDMLAYFKDPNGGFFDTRSDHEPLLVRPKELQDNAVPSGNSLATLALLNIYAYTGENKWRTHAEDAMSAVTSLLSRYPTAFGKWLCAADFMLGPVQEVAILGDPSHPLYVDLIREVWQTYQPRIVMASSEFPPPKNSPPILGNRALLDGMPTAYVCKNFVCHQPVNTVEDLSNQL